MEGDVPEPTLPVARLEDHRRAFVAASVAIGAIPVRPDRTFIQDGIPQAKLETVLEQSRLAAGVHDHLRVDFTACAVGILDADTGRPVALEEDVEHVDAFMGIDAVLARVVEHHLVELAADHLPRLRALVRFVVPEVERGRQLAARIYELHAVLLDEVAPLHLRQHVETLQDPVGLRNQRLADVEARKFLALEQPHTNATLREQRRRGRTRRSATDNNDVVITHRGKVSGAKLSAVSRQRQCQVPSVRCQVSGAGASARCQVPKCQVPSAGDTRLTAGTWHLAAGS